MALPSLPGRGGAGRMTGRWHIFDSGLFFAGGHHANQAQGLAEELHRRGIAATFHAVAAVDQRLLQDVVVKPTFRRYLYDILSPDEECGELEDFLALNGWYLDDLRRLGHEPFGAADTVLVPTATHNQLWGVVQWAASLPAERRPKTIVASLMFPPDWTPHPRAICRPGVYYRFILRNCPPATVFRCSRRPSIHLAAKWPALREESLRR